MRFAFCAGGAILSFLCLPGNAHAVHHASVGVVAQVQAAPNAGDQQNDSAGVKLAAKIRKALIRDKNLSVRAHNVTVIVKNGAVTLRGEVHSEQEREAIRNKVQSVAGSAHVDDLMTIKP